MSKVKETGVIDASTEEKIKIAARKVFQQKGFAATRTRDIAEEANINLALLNYYFRSKEKLFEIIMLETMSVFLGNVTGAFNDDNTTFEQKIEFLAANYIDMFIEKPDIPLFILSEIRNRPEDLLNKIPARQILTNSVFARQFQEKAKKGQIKEPNLFHFMINFMGMTILPFVGKPFLTAASGLNEAQFNKLMQERKKLIPVWIKAIMKAE